MKPSLVPIACATAGAVLGTKLLAYASPTFEDQLEYLSVSVQARVSYWLSTVCCKWRTQFDDIDGPPGPGETKISAKWLTRLFHEQGVIDRDTRVTKVESQQVNGNRGLMGSLQRFNITYSKPMPENKSAGSGAPTVLVLKMTVNTYQHRLGTVGAREPFFYQRYAPGLRASSDAKVNGAFDVPLPRVFYAYGNRWTGTYVVLSEDLLLRGTGVNMYCGNQIYGVPATLHPVPQLKVMEKVFLYAADLHASAWNNNALLKQRWLKAADWYNGQGRPMWSLAQKAAQRRWANSAHIIQNKTDLRWSDKFIAIMNHAIKHSTWDNFQRHLQAPQPLTGRRLPFTRTHGDWHASNMIYLHQHDESPDQPLRVVDWSEFGVWEPSQDLGQMMISDVKPEFRRQHEKYLVRLYYDRLISRGTVNASEYPFELCWSRYQIAPVEHWIWLFSILIVLCPRPLPYQSLQYFHDQMMAYIDDHAPQHDTTASNELMAQQINYTFKSCVCLTVEFN